MVCANEPQTKAHVEVWNPKLGNQIVRNPPSYRTFPQRRYPQPSTTTSIHRLIHPQMSQPYSKLLEIMGVQNFHLVKQWFRLHNQSSASRLDVQEHRQERHSQSTLGLWLKMVRLNIGTNHHHKFIGTNHHHGRVISSYSWKWNQNQNITPPANHQ